MSILLPGSKRDGRSPVAKTMRTATLIVTGQTLAVAVITIAVAMMISLALDHAMAARSVPSLVWLTVLGWAFVVAAFFTVHARDRIIGQYVALVAMDNRHSCRLDASSLFGAASPTAATIAIADTIQLPLFVIAASLIQPMAGGIMIGVSGAMALAIIFRARSSPMSANKPTTHPAAPDMTQVRNAGFEAIALGLPARWKQFWLQQADSAVEQERLNGVSQSYARLMAAIGCVSAFFAIVLVLAITMASGKTTIGNVGSILLLSAVSLYILRRIWNVAPNLAALNKLWRPAADSRTVMISRQPALTLPASTKHVTLKSLTVRYSGDERATIRDLSCRLLAGSVTTVMGPSGSGKSSLLRAMTGVWPVCSGSIELDDTNVQHCDSAHLARHIGYLGQSPRLFSGTIAANIASFDQKITDTAIIGAAKKVGIHELILRLTSGYAQHIDEGDNSLPASLRQGIALARIFVRRPTLLLLDDPFVHLDPKSAQMVETAIEAARQQQAVVMIASNDQQAVDLADQLMVLREGVMIDFGQKLHVWDRARAIQSDLQKNKLYQPAHVPKPYFAAGEAL